MKSLVLSIAISDIETTIPNLSLHGSDDELLEARVRCF